MEHQHGTTPTDPPASRPRIRRGLSIFLWVAVLGIITTTTSGVWLLWPRHTVTPPGRLPSGTVHVDPVDAVVVSVTRQVCPGTTVQGNDPAGGSADSFSPDPSLGGDDSGLVTDASCLIVQARLLAGPQAGTVQPVPVTGQVVSGGLHAGDRVTLARFPADAGMPTTYGWVDYSRQRPLSVLALGFVLIVLAVARWRGITALVGLGLGYLTIGQFMLPALRAGQNPLGVALTGSVTIMVVILYVAHGFSAKTTTALLGTVFGLAAASSLAWWASGAAHLDGLATDDNLSLTTLPGGGLRGVILCGTVLAGLGVLNDVTVTQASAVWELAAHAPHLRVRGLFTSGMRIGRDHLASTVYTLAFAYAGVALPTLMLVEMFQTPWLQVATSGQVAEEVVRTLVGAIGLVLAIPLTTLVAALVVSIGSHPRSGPPDPAVNIDADHPDHRPGQARIPVSLDVVPDDTRPAASAVIGDRP
ncbi:MAG TPA: YibE/F family protein [Kineosporiaceae bacterium]|nr:YibE/F family protein [Kineosporiaceae bacterium]